MGCGDLTLDLEERAPGRIRFAGWLSLSILQRNSAQAWWIGSPPLWREFAVAAFPSRRSRALGDNRLGANEVRHHVGHLAARGSEASPKTHRRRRTDARERKERGLAGPHSSRGKPCVRAHPNVISTDVCRGDLLGAAIAPLKRRSGRIGMAQQTCSGGPAETAEALYL